MTKSIKQIQSELNNLETTTTKTASILEELYQEYLSSLGQSVKQQLILASYQICTQFYPQSFLDLSLSNKQELQQTIKQIGAEVEPALLAIIDDKELEPEPSQLDLMAELIKNLPKSPPSQSDKDKNDSESEFDSESEEIAEIDIELVKSELEKIEFITIEDAKDLKSELENPEQKSEDSDSNLAVDPPPREQINFGNPKHLVLWHKQIERTIKKTLEYTSQKANKRLQSAEIIPSRIKNNIIDVAISAESSKGKKSRNQSQGTPNILHLAIESDSSKKRSKLAKHITNVSLLRLRISELEFCDPLLNAQRGKIRNLVSEINVLHNQYQATKKVEAIAEAEAAWRSSWFDD